MEVFIEKFSLLIEEVARSSEPGFNQYDYTSLKPYFNQPAYFRTDYPFMVDFSGNHLIHLYKEGQRYPRELLNRMFAEPNKKGRFDFEDYRNNDKHTMMVYFKKVEAYNAFVGITVDTDEVFSDLRIIRTVLIFLALGCSILVAFLIHYAISPFTRFIEQINNIINRMSMGEFDQTITYTSNDEFGNISKSLNALIFGIKKASTFANEIGHEKLNTPFDPLGPNDKLGNALLGLRETLKISAREEAVRKLEDERRNWINTGLAKFSDILRQNNNNLQLLSDSVTLNLVNYLNANQGGLFILNEDIKEEPRLELLSAFAFNRRKAKKKTILVGEGLVGNCVIEKHTIYLKEIPDDYIEITSGLGDAPPRTLLIVPLKIEERVFGVFEMASFNEFLPHEVEFVEKIGESIASTLSAVKNSIRTAELLEQSQQQREEMAAQEEEMRQNMEEMLATQEEMARKTMEMEGMTAAINESLLFCELTQEGNFSFSNPNLMSLLGYVKHDLEEMTLSEFIHPNEKGSFRSIWNDVISGNPFKGVIRWVNRLEEELFILCSITPSFDENGSLFKIFLLGQDVTQSKQLELKAQKQAEEIEQNLLEVKMEQEISQQKEEEMKALLQALDKTCLVTEIDVDGKITYINNKNVDTLGDSKEMLEGKYHHEIDFQAKNQPEHYRNLWNNIMDGLPQRREFSLFVKGKTVWISEFYTPIINENGKVSKVINIGIDITESKETEIRLQKIIKDLEQQILKK
jgi:methyl-accepting chemotaxis protein